MNKFFFSGLVALGLAAVSHDEASAWVNFKFSAGVNMQLQSGNNNILWGAFRNGQVPEGHHGVHPGMPPFHGGPPGAQFPYFGYAAPVPTSPAAAPAPAAPAGTSVTAAPGQQTFWYGGNPFHTVGYNPSYNPYTPASYSGHYYPSYYGYYYAPSYWYGR